MEKKRKITVNKKKKDKFYLTVVRGKRPMKIKYTLNKCLIRNNYII